MHPEFPLDDAIIHLNHAGVGPWPERTVRTIQEFAEQNMRMGSSRYRDWLKVESELRERCRWLINAESADDIALVKNTSEGLSMVAYGIDWQAGDNIVTSQQEFPSNRIVWQSLEKRFGVEVRLADLDSAKTPEQALIDMMDNQTRLLAVSSVQYASGLRMNLGLLGKACHNVSALFCIDAIQSLGVIPFDVEACQADFVIADGHKWMLAPEGLALFYVNPQQRLNLQLNQFGWHMMEDMSDYSKLEWEPAGSARRFECGSPNNLCIHALNASLSLLQETGIQNIFDSVSENITYIHDVISKHEVKFLSSMETDRISGCITFRFPHVDNAQLFNALQKQNVLCAYRAGGIRFSPHFYTERRQIDRAMQILDGLLASRDLHHGQN